VSVSLSKEPARIAGMFDAIARRYDALNHLLSAGLDRRWRRQAAHALALSGRERVLDMCTGTADLAIAVLAAGAHDVVGIDFSSEMLRLAAQKVRSRDLSGRLRLVRGDATAIPLDDRTVDAATVAFGIRNVIDPLAAASEFLRVLQPGGRLAILEFGTPTLPGLRSLYLWYFRRVLPRLGRLFSRHADAYAYLPGSVLEFPSGRAFCDLLRRSGFTNPRAQPLCFGIVYLYVATAPA
jgi:demethylmenaquinone methyltransferase/2-methoxy-6-polyprenyl-1,4-benzoquinol methylase